MGNGRYAMRAIITVGMGFGDEGKGATVDALTRQFGAQLVVRYCGGAQAGHNVQLPDGRRHTFSQFGAGTLAGARTYLGPSVIVSPALMVPEAEHLRQLGIPNPWRLLSAHPDCLVATSYHVLMNRLREIARGAERHGSCGLGVGETRHYWLRFGHDAITVEDLLDRTTLEQKLTLMRERFFIEMQELATVDRELSEQLCCCVPAAEAGMLDRASQQLDVARHMPPCDLAIFEGAQGVLLDQWYGFHPYTTWSTVTPQHALELLAESNCSDIQVLGITRAYTTRHGAGPFPTACNHMTGALFDAGNPTNDWQGTIRSGPLDLVLLRYAASVCCIDGLVVNCLDQLPERPRLCDKYQSLERLAIPCTQREQEELTVLLENIHPIVTECTREDLLASLGEIAPVVATAYGPSSRERSVWSAAPRRNCPAETAYD